MNKKQLYSLGAMLLTASTALAKSKCDVEEVKRQLSSNGDLFIRAQDHLNTFSYNDSLRGVKHLEFLAQGLAEFCTLGGNAAKSNYSLAEISSWTPILRSVLIVQGFDVFAANHTGRYDNFILDSGDYDPVFSANMLSAVIENGFTACQSDHVYLSDDSVTYAAIEEYAVEALTDDQYQEQYQQHSFKYGDLVKFTIIEDAKNNQRWIDDKNIAFYDAHYARLHVFTDWVRQTHTATNNGRQYTPDNEKLQQYLLHTPTIAD